MKWKPESRKKFPSFYQVPRGLSLTKAQYTALNNDAHLQKGQGQTTNSEPSDTSKNKTMDEIEVFKDSNSKYWPLPIHD